MKTQIGLHCSHEQHSPSALLRYTQMAADAGFTIGMCSDRVLAKATPDDVRSHIRVSSEIEQHIAWLQEDRALGFRRIYLHNVVREHQQRFISMCASGVRPALER